MRLLICAGGTGGGVYPALVVLQTLLNNGLRETSSGKSVTRAGLRKEDVLWVCGIGGMEVELLKRVDIPLVEIPAAGVHGVGLRALPGNMLRLLRGVLASRSILRQFNPDVLFFTGGYLAVPMALASSLAIATSIRPRRLLYVPDIEPGLALKTLIRFVDHIALTVEASRAFLPGSVKSSVTGYPVRAELRTWKLTDARRALGLSSDLPTLLVYGGSKGARSINRALLTVLPDLLGEVQVVHITGNLDWPEVEKTRRELEISLPAGRIERYRVFPYLHDEMGAAFTAANLVVSRAGASCLGEFPVFGIPAILVPYPHAWRYQQVNADYLRQHGAAEIIHDSDLREQLLPMVQGLIGDPERLSKMSAAMAALAQPEAAHALANRLFALAAEKRGAQ